jgi:alkylation response protein AidB-like acyl-CoA dehydrogenase
MAIAITEDHRALGETVADFVAKRDARGAARALLTAADESRPAFWDDMAELGWLGLHIPEQYGGSGYGLSELVVVVEELGRALTPGPFVPTVIASATLAAAAPPEIAQRWLPDLVSGAKVGAVSLDGEIALGGGLADVLLVAMGNDVAVIDTRGSGVTVTVPPNLDPTRRVARIKIEGTPTDVLPGARALMLDYARLIIAADATGIARECTELAAEYAKVRQQFGRPIAMYQAVKHHCANMLVDAELATANVWDAARAASHDPDQFSLAAAMAAALALPAADWNAQLNMQVHGGIGFTWEHDAHVYLRRATALEAIINAEAAREHVTELVRRGVRRTRSVDLPPEADSIRTTVRAFADSIKGRDYEAQRAALIESGYVMPHWPAPWGRAADAVEQLVIEQEFAAAGIKRPQYGITAWVILTLIQHANEDQVARWVPPALRQDLIWCQLFSEPDAGSDAAGIKTRATRTDGGWLINGQKVWTSGAHVAAFGLATVRTDPDVAKHDGITTMVVDMHAEGVEVRPLKMPTGTSEFNEVFFNDVFIPDDDVVGPVNGGWTVARATLGNESVSIGSGGGGGTLNLTGDAFIGPFDAHPERLTGGEGRIGRYIAQNEAMAALNLRSAHRAVAGGGPGPEGNVTKLVLSELGHDASAMLNELTGADAAFTDGAGAMNSMLVLFHRAISIAGGTSEIKRNQIGERILGLPRDPLIN